MEARISRLRLRYLTAISFIQGGAGPLILSWINEICSSDTEKRALLVAAANDLAYVVQAVVCIYPWIAISHLKYAHFFWVDALPLPIYLGTEFRVAYG